MQRHHQHQRQDRNNALLISSFCGLLCVMSVFCSALSFFVLLLLTPINVFFFVDLKMLCGGVGGV